MAKSQKNTVLSADTFSVEGKVYKMLLHSVNIPDVGIRTAAEVLIDEEAQKKLVEIGCIGTVIQEVI